MKGTLKLVLCLITHCSVLAYNVDTEFPIIFDGSDGSYFGYTTAFYRNSLGPLVLIGAPKSNSTFSKTVNQPGSLFQCNIPRDGGKPQCKEVLLTREGPEEFNRSLQYYDMKDGMWLGVSLDVGQKDIVTCGHLWRNRYHTRLHLTNGVCYVINKNLDSESIKLLPLTDRSMQFGKSHGLDEYNYAHGQAGMSALFSEDGANLILGAPGILTWKGSIVEYLIETGRSHNIYKNPSVPVPPTEIKYGSYFGYSVTTGKFVLSGQMYAVGAPKDGMNNGKVYIISGVDKKPMKIHFRKFGFQMGEYFGASVLGVDLNGDTRTDLLVGAPTNSRELGGDEGKVYVYISNGKDLVKSDVELTGDGRVSARFGTALAKAGDINQDRYEDVAIGAPYEDGYGAVYIYHGSKNGIISQYVQKIEAVNVNPKLSGFGIHISRGYDIDDNGYPDLLVGSYRSSHAVLFRSRPIIRVYPEIIFTPKQIDRNETCGFNGQNLICIKVDACLRYRGYRVSSPLKFVFTLKMLDNRGFISDNTSNKLSGSKKKEVHMSMNDKLCQMFRIFLNPTTKDFLTPIPVQFSSSLVQPNDFKIKFDKKFAIYHPSSLSNLIDEIAFSTGCGDEGICNSNLNVSAIRTEPTGDGFMTLGEFSRVSVNVRVKNNGEPAYLTELLIFIPPELSTINDVHLCESTNEGSNASLICNIGNPLLNNTPVDIHLRLDATKIPPLTEYLEIGFEAVTKSNDIDPTDNEGIRLPLWLITVADFGVAGYAHTSISEQIIYDGKNNMSPILTHTYIIRNHGPSPLQTIEFELLVPYAFITPDGLKPFLFVTSPKVDNRMQFTIQARCDDSELKSVRRITEDRVEIINDESMLSNDVRETPASFIPENIVSSPSGLTHVQPDNIESEQGQTRNVSGSVDITGPVDFSIGCGANQDIECATVRCQAAPFPNLRYAQISIGFELDFDALNDQLVNWDQIEFVTSGSISVPDNIVKVLNHHPKEAHVRTVVSHNRPLSPKKVSFWIIIAAIGGGALLLLIIFIILVKVGFFKRKEKDQMKKLKNEVKPKLDQEIKDTEVLSQ